MQHTALEPLMDSLGPDDPEIVAIVRSGEAWQVRYEDVDVEIEENAEAGRYFLATRVGLPPHDSSEELYVTLLQYNMLRRDTEACLAMDDDRAVVQTVELSSANMTSASLLDVVQNVATKTRAWRLFINRAAEAPAGEDDLSSLLTTAIRI